MRNKAKYSILVPVYNHEDFIKDCIDSIIDQQDADFEVIFCDDCSSDKSLEIIMDNLARLKKVATNVVAIRNDKNVGCAATMNKMIGISSGEYIKLFAGDDYLVQGYLKSATKFLEEKPLTDILICNGNRVKENSHYLKDEIIDIFYNNTFRCIYDNAFENMYKNNYFFAPGLIIRKALFDEYGGFDENLRVEDWELWLRFLNKKQCKIEYLDGIYINYRININSATSLQLESSYLDERRAKYYSDIITILKKYREFVNPTVYRKTLTIRTCEEYNICVKKKLKNTKRIIKDVFISFIKDETIRVSEKLIFIADIGYRFMTENLYTIYLKFKE